MSAFDDTFLTYLREDMDKHYESINAEFVRKIMEEKK